MSLATRLLVVTSAGLLVGCGARSRVVPPPPASPTVAVAPFTGHVAPEVKLVADPIAFTGAATAQVEEVVRQVEEVARKHPDAAAYRPGDIL